MMKRIGRSKSVDSNTERISKKGSQEFEPESFTDAEDRIRALGNVTDN